MAMIEQEFGPTWHRFAILINDIQSLFVDWKWALWVNSPYNLKRLSDEFVATWSLSDSTTVPLRITLDSISAPFIASKTSSPRSVSLPTHWMSPVESLKTTNRSLLEPRVRFIHPFNSMVCPLCNPSWISPIHTVLAILPPVLPFGACNSMSPFMRLMKISV